MTTSSDDRPDRPARSTSPYARFIPREELQGFAAWKPDGFAGAPAPGPAEPPVLTPAQLRTALQAQRQAGYQDGYRDGLAALEAFKQSHAQQMAAQLGTLIEAFNGQLDAIEHALAEAVAKTATALARQVVRAELTERPELVARVAEEAVNAVLLSARQIRVHVHADDLALVAQGAEEALAARGARLGASPQVRRGGCLIESDVGTIDARIDTRWAQAAAVFGQTMPWADVEEPA